MWRHTVYKLNLSFDFHFLSWKKYLLISICATIPTSIRIYWNRAISIIIYYYNVSSIILWSWRVGSWKQKLHLVRLMKILGKFGLLDFGRFQDLLEISAIEDFVIVWQLCQLFQSLNRKKSRKVDEIGSENVLTILAIKNLFENLYKFAKISKKLSKCW